MRTTIIPAQITTVEDTIAGSLNLTQILLLVSSLFINTFIYALLPIRLTFTPYKIPLIIIVFIVCILLSLRIKQRIVLDWLTIFLVYALRPHLYLFTKNSDFARQTSLPPVFSKKNATEEKKSSVVREVPTISFDYQSLIRNPDLNIRFKRNSIQVVKNYE